MESIKEGCPKIQVKGLMSIGKVDDIDGFHAMYELKQKILETFHTPEEEFIMSIGTSQDYENAIIEGGSTEIRIGTQIFGKRLYSNVDKMKEDAKKEEESKSESAA